ncbi:MAG: hypothetical protein CW691_06130 [Candidatus Bathyarchaeum sp.]|nr:MAG: hypothetical protein CW691_06130 [Candidatus Bathyarchaeum sp.]
MLEVHLSLSIETTIKDMKVVLLLFTETFSEKGVFQQYSAIRLQICSWQWTALFVSSWIFRKKARSNNELLLVY